MAEPSRGKSDAIALGLGGVVATLFLAASVSPAWIDWVVQMETSPITMPLIASEVPQDYRIGVYWAIFLGGVVAIWGTMAKFRGPLLSVWIAKVLVDLGPMLFYDYRYGVDPDGYYKVASFMDYVWEGFQVGHGTENVRGLTWLHMQFLSSSFTATRLTFSLIGLIAMYFAYRAAAICVGRDDHRLFYVFAFIPSVLFWSSTLSKEPITLLGVAAYTYGVVAWHRLALKRGLFWILAGVMLGAYVRIWLASLLLAPLAVFVLLSATGKRRLGFAALATLGLLLAPVVVQQQLQADAFGVDDMLEKANRDSRSFMAGGSSQETPELDSLGSLTRFAPLGMFTVLFRPIPGEVPNAWGLLTGLENTILLFLAARAIARTRMRDLRDPLVLWAILTVFFWAFTYSINAYQNLGTAARHKLEIMPLFVGLMVYQGRRRDSTADAAVLQPSQLPPVFGPRRAVLAGGRGLRETPMRGAVAGRGMARTGTGVRS